MRQRNQIVRFEETPGPDGALQRVLVACNLTSDAAPEGEVRYWEHLFTPAQVVEYQAAEDPGAYVRGVIADASPSICERWLAELAARRVPEPRRYSPEEIRTRLGAVVEVEGRGPSPRGPAGGGTESPAENAQPGSAPGGTGQRRAGEET